MMPVMVLDVPGASVGFVAESAAIPEADVDFGEVTLMPSTLKSLKVLIRFSNELLRQSVVALDAVLKQRLVTDVSNALDDALLTGARPSAWGCAAGRWCRKSVHRTQARRWQLP